MPFEASAPPLPANDILPPGSPDTGLATPEDIAFQPATSCDIQDLIEAPCRTLDVEYKSWRNLDHNEDRAELARDIAALANHGGGHIVFGFDELTLLPDDTDPFRTNCTAERVSAIVQNYLDPPIRCEVAAPMSANGVIHPVIRVAGHGITPVCIRQDGPIVGTERLVERGAFYFRKQGPVPFGRAIGVPMPQSAKIEMPQDWAALIRRCVRRDRDAMMSILEAAIEGRSILPDIAQRLLSWHRAARSAFLALVPRSPIAERLAGRHYVLSYAFELIRPEVLEQAQLPERLRHTVFEVQTRFKSGWNMFDPPYRRGVQARFITDPAVGDDETDFLETAWLRARIPTEMAEFWRVSPHGMATIIRGYKEDTDGKGAFQPVRAGACLSPEVLTQEVAELICHATAYARLFGGVRRVTFRCEWWGLAGRELHDPANRWPHHGPALSDHCVATAQVPAARLLHGWPETVAQLIAPVIRAIEPDIQLGPTWVRSQAERWATEAGL